MMLLRVGVALVVLSWPLATYADKGDDDDETDTDAGTHVEAKTVQKDKGPQGTVVQAQTIGRRGRAELPHELVCENVPWPYKLIDERTEIGPARFATQSSIESDLLLTAGAIGECVTLSQNNGFDTDKHAASLCRALEVIVDKQSFIASGIFGKDSQQNCLRGPARANDGCERARSQLATLRSHDEIARSRAELVLAHSVCAKPAATGTSLRAACTAFEAVITAEAGDAGGVGPFAIDAGLPPSVSKALDPIRRATDGRFQGSGPLLATQNAICLAPAEAHQPKCRPTSPMPDTSKQSNEWLSKLAMTGWGMCSELDVADCRVDTCRSADVYIDERGEIHLNKLLTTREERKKATLCVDISDFDPEHQLMVTVGLRGTQSVPERIWPGETFEIGPLIDKAVTSEDVLSIAVYGKPRGVSLAEVLDVNGIYPDPQQKDYVGWDHDEACRIAVQYVPVVEHEVPIGDTATQAVVPVLYGRGRTGETKLINGGDSILVWVRDIPPGGAVVVQESSGTFVSYEPPPLLGRSDDTALSKPTNQIGNTLRSAENGVDLPRVPRRARYPGSRVLRVGHPVGNNEYALNVCTGPADSLTTTARRTCDPNRIVVGEKLYVHGTYHLGIRAHFGYSWFGGGELVADRTPRAQALGADVYELKERHLAQQDFAFLLALYPWGRDPYRFDYKGNYLRNAALLAGFTMRKAEVWENIYLGGSLPIANGVSLTVLANLALRERPFGVRAGDLVTSMSTPNLTSTFGSERQLDVGVSVGVSFDYDLAARVFKNVWDKVTQKTPAPQQAAQTESETP